MHGTSEEPHLLFLYIFVALFHSQGLQSKTVATLSSSLISVPLEKPLHSQDPRTHVQESMALALLSEKAKQLQDAMKEKPAFVSKAQEWDRMHPNMAMLWPGMNMSQLMATMEEVYGFRATINQYKKKFQEWYRKDMLPPKKKKRHGLPGSDLDLPVKSSYHECVPQEHSDRALMPRFDWGVPNEENALTGAMSPDDEVDDTPISPLPTPSVALVPPSHEHQLGPLAAKQQNKFNALLCSLWDTYFDAEFGHVEAIEVGAVVRNMIEFIVSINMDDAPNNMPITSRDLGFVYKAFTLALAKYPSIVHIVDKPYPSAQACHNNASPGLIALRRSADDADVPETIRYCCQCGDGPYLRWQPACSMSACNSHKFCRTCVMTFEAVSGLKQN